VANVGDDTVSVLSADGSGGNDLTSIAVGAGPASIAIGQLDGRVDNPDIPVANFD
jgi:hypothetical protein